MKLRRQREVYGEDDDQYSTKNFRFDFTASPDPSLRLIVPDKNPHIIAVEPEDGMVKCLNGYLMWGAICVKINTITWLLSTAGC